jgi:hypothetical protein
LANYSAPRIAAVAPLLAIIAPFFATLDSLSLSFSA